MSNETMFSSDPFRFFFKFGTIVELDKKLTYMPIFISIGQAVFFIYIFMQ